jgi:hypothetical protein
MEAKEILEKVKLFFNDLVAPTTVAAAVPPVASAPVTAMAKEYELEGGGTVTIDKMEVGGIVMIDGSPALPGDIKLADGTAITIADNGMIEVITMPSEEAAPVVEDMTAKFAAFQSLTTEKFANYETKFSAYEQRFADYEVKMKKANKVIEELLKLSTLIVEAPSQAHDPAVRTQNNFKGQNDYTPALFNN